MARTSVLETQAENYFAIGLKFFLLVPMLSKTHERRQITKLCFAGN
jgi:hypothetical protein